MYRFCCKKKKRTALNFATTFRNLPQPGLLRDRFDSQAVQRAASLFNSFCSNFAKQVALFCSPFYCSFIQWDLFWPERKRGASLMQRTAHPVSLLAGDKSVSSFEAYLKTTTLKTWCGAWRSLPADHDSTWRKWSYFTNELRVHHVVVYVRSIWIVQFNQYVWKLYNATICLLQAWLSPSV